ncbi:MAG TPA: sulfatase [Opitutaceae bacterium]|nr:sulfatase [Opitutaceae bacterium]
MKTPASKKSDLTRRGFLGQMAGAAAVASLPQIIRAQTAKTGRKPNVLFFMSDDMRVEIGCYNSLFGAKTPNLDALARAGVRFDRNYCQYPICNPSRTSLLTNRHPTTTRVLGNNTNFRNTNPDLISLPQLFRANGYATARTGKIFHGGMDDPKAWGQGHEEPAGPGGGGGKRMDVPRPPSGTPHSEPSDKMRIVDASKANEPDYRSADHATQYVLPALAGDVSRAAESDQLIVLDGEGEGHPDYHTATTAIKYLNEHKDEPFFIGCGFVKPHSPLCATQKFLDMYPLDKIQLTPDFAPWPTVPPGFPSAAIRRHNADLFIGRGATEEEAKMTIRHYIASIGFADWNLGRVVAELDRLGLRDNTIIVFIVDHGYQLGEKGKWSKAGSLFEPGCRVPLMIAAPGMAGNGRSCYRIVQSIDLYSTLTELCGLETPPGGEGVSLTSLLRNPEAAWDKPAYSVWSEDSRTLHGVAVRTEKFRYAEYGPEGVNGAMLLDPKADPLELKNLANDPAYASVCRELSALTRNYAAHLGKPQPA